MPDPAALLSLAVPLIMYIGALPSRAPFRLATGCNLVALTVLAVSILMTQVGDDNALRWLPGTGTHSVVIGLLVCFLSYVLVQFSRNYLAGDPNKEHYTTHLQLTAGSVLLVVLSDHLAVFIVGWVAISLGLHKLLLFYPDRPEAVEAARKKFLFARLAELLLIGAAILLYQEFNTLHIETLLASIRQQGAGDLGSLAAVLLAVAALIKCAQLPLHGWLIQVVEAPTPVSALLHAGVINMGGVLLITFAPLISAVTSAQWTLLIGAGLSTLVAALVMQVEVSVKARLAWSTSAQMGLMLIQCALGLYQLALLHLLAHSAYKAFVFLSAGSVVARREGTQTTTATGITQLALLGSIIGASVVIALQLNDTTLITPWLLTGILLAMAIIEASGKARLSGKLMGVILACLLLLLHSGQAWLSGYLIDASQAAMNNGGDLWLSGLIVGLVGMSWWLREYSQHPSSRRLRALLFSGFFIDAWINRATRTLWRHAGKPISPALSPTDRPTTENYS